MRIALLVLALLPLACGSEEPAAPAAPPAPEIDLAMASDPGGGLSVKEAKEKGPGEEVLVVGRVSNVVGGFAALNLVDDELEYCGRTDPADKCKTPWDYCCIANDERAEATLTVEHRGPDGRALPGRIPSIRLLDLLVVKGRVEKDEHGNVTIVPTAWFRRERPDLPDGLRWPE